MRVSRSVNASCSIQIKTSRHVELEQNDLKKLFQRGSRWTVGAASTISLRQKRRIVRGARSENCTSSSQPRECVRHSHDLKAAAASASSQRGPSRSQCNAVRKQAPPNQFLHEGTSALSALSWGCSFILTIDLAALFVPSTANTSSF